MGDVEEYPGAIRAREWWVAWILDGAERKRPVAPWKTGHAYPVEWRGDLEAEERPETTFETAKRWTDFGLSDLGLSLPEDALSDELRLGIILPVDRPPRDERVVLIDWDDVRDPETGDVHPVAREYIDEHGGYVEVSRSGEGLHQFVFGGLRHREKFIAPIDTKPFVGDDLPQVEIYDGGRHVAMTGDRHPFGGDDVVEAQACIDDIVREYAQAELDAGYRSYDPETGATPRHAEVGNDDIEAPVPDPEPAEYDGPSLEELRASKPADRSVAYHAVVEAFCEGYAGVLNWRIEGAAAALGQREDRTVNEVVADLRGEDREGGSVGYDRKTPGRVEYDHARAARDEFNPASWETLASWGVLPLEYVEDLSNAETVPIAVLPGVRDLTKWDWRDASPDPVHPTQEAVWERTHDAIADAFERGDQVLIDAPPAAGKSTAALEAAAETREPITYLCPRREVMEERAEQARELGLDVYTLPSFPKHCDTACGEHGEGWQQEVMGPYKRGARPKDIHKDAGWHFDQPLPCQQYESQECPYTARWRFEPEDYDVLIGHYNHGHKQKVTTSRTVVIDEFSRGCYETTLDSVLSASVTAFLRDEEDIPFEDFTDLLSHREDTERRENALQWFAEEEPGSDSSIPLSTDHGHAAAPLAVYTMLAAYGNRLDEYFERTPLPNGGVGIYDREATAVRLLVPPDLRYTSGVVALDGTPTRWMWELTLGIRLNHRQVLTDEELAEYISETLDISLVQTSEYMKPYSGNADYVSVDEDRALLEEISEQHGEQPDLITTLTAEKVYGEAGVLDEFVRDHEHYGNLKSSNQFATRRLGVVAGSRHFGDAFIKRWGAYKGQHVERSGKGVDLTYSGIGQDVYEHMTHNETLQAALRFGRDGKGAVVYVHTAALPDWVPISGEGRVLRTWSDGMRQVLAVIQDLEKWTTAEVAAHPEVEVGQRQVLNLLSDLSDRGVIDGEIDGNGYTWWADGLHRLSEHGDVELEPVSIDELSETESAEIARIGFFRWAISSDTDRGSQDDPSPPGDVGSMSPTPVEAMNRGGSPTDDCR